MIYYNNINKIKNKEKSKLIKEACEEIIKKSKNISKISIFGSVARGDDRIDSDIDFYLEFNCLPIDENYIYIDDVDNVIDILNNKTYKKGGCDTVIKNDFCEYSEKFIKNLRKDEIILYER